MDKRKKNKKQSLRQHFFRFFLHFFFLGWEKSAFVLVFRCLRRFGEGLFFSASLLPHLRRSLAGKAAGQADGGLEALEVLASRDFYGAELLGDGR